MYLRFFFPLSFIWTPPDSLKFTPLYCSNMNFHVCHDVRSLGSSGLNPMTVWKAKARMLTVTGLKFNKRLLRIE